MQTILATDGKNASFAIFLYEDPFFFASTDSIGFRTVENAVNSLNLQSRNMFRIDG